MSPTRLLKIALIGGVVVLLGGVAAVAFGPSSGASQPGSSSSPSAGASSPTSAPQTPVRSSPSTPTPTSTPGYTIAAAGDIACDPTNEFFNRGRGTKTWCRQEATGDLIRRIDPKLVLALGDLQYENGALKKFREAYDRAWGSFKSATLPVVGNHEYYTRNAAGYFDYWGARAGHAGRGWYSRDIPSVGWHLVALNANCEVEIDCRAGSAEYDWLKQDLRSSPASCTLAFMHQPRWSSGPHGSDRFVAPLVQLMYAGGVDVLLTGHDHIYERFAPMKPDGSRAIDGIREFVVGTGGAQHYWIEHRQPGSVVRDAKTFGVLRMSLRDGGYAWRFMGLGGSSFTDGGTATCH